MNVDPALAAWVDAAARMLELPLTATERAGVVGHLGRIAEFARLVEDAALGEHDESAAVFRPGSRG